MGLVAEGDIRAVVVTFDDGAREVWQGTAPTQATLLEKLPAVPLGEQTDIGAAIDLGVSSLKRDDGRPVAAIVLITDGELDAAPTSKYPSATAPAWAELRTAADATVATPDDVTGYLAGLTDQLTRVRIAEVLGVDLTDPLTATLEPSSVQGTTLMATATFVSTATTVPYLITAADLLPPADGVALIMDPPSLELEPGATATATVTVSGLPTTGSFALQAQLDSPWAVDLQAAGLTIPALLETPPVAFDLDAATPAPSQTPSPTQGADEAGTSGSADAPEVAIPSWLAPGAAGLAALVALALVIARLVLARLPHLGGSLAILDGDDVTDEVLLTGRSLRTRRDGLKLAAKARRDGKVDVSGTSDGQRFSGTLDDGDSLEAGAAHVRYTSKRSRMLEMVTGD